MRGILERTRRRIVGARAPEGRRAGNATRTPAVRPEPGARWAAWVLRWRWPVLAASLAATIGMGYGAGSLRFGNNYRLFFGDDNPQVAAFDALERIYTKNDNVLFVVEAPSGDAFSELALGAALDLEDRAWQLPFAARVEGITNFQHTEAYGDDLLVEDLLPAGASADPAAREKARGVALDDPLVVHRLAGAEGRATGVNVTVFLPDDSDDPEARPALVDAARALAADIEARHPGIDVRLTGMVMLNNAFFEASQNDMQTLVPLMYLGIIVLLYLLLRSVVGVIGTLSVIGLATISAMGLAGWAGIVLTPPSATAPTLILTLAVADCVHILVTLLQRMRAGDEKSAAIVESLRVNLGPVFLTSLTTAIGFLSMNFSDSPPFRDLGNMTALGVGLAFLFAVVFLPALVGVLPLRVRARSEARTSRFARLRWEEPLAEFVLRNRRPLLGGTAALALGLAAIVPMNDLNDQFVRYFDHSVQFRADSDYAMDNLTGLYTVEFSVESGQTGGISEPAYLATLDSFAEWYRAQPGVLHVLSFADIMKRLNRNMHGDDPATYHLPETRDLAAQYLLLYEMSLPFGQDLNNQINVDKSSTRFIVTLDDLSSHEIRETAAAGERWLAAHGASGMVATASGPSLMFAHISGRNIRGMLMGTALALVLVSACLVIAFRSVGYGALSLIPNLAPALLAFGAWGILVGQINIALSTVAAMTIGIVVDDTIHFLSKYLRARREHGHGAEDALRYAFRNVGPAMVFTSLVLAGGFLILSLSAFDLNAGMGKLTAITIGFALFTDFLMLGPLLVLVAEARAKRLAPRPRLALSRK